MDTNIDKLVNVMQKFPGIGPKSALRLVLYMIKNKNNIMSPLLSAVDNLIKVVDECSICGNISFESKVCDICLDREREKDVICIVENVNDLWSFEKSGAYKGLYHVLGGALSAVNGIGPKDIKIDSLIERVRKNKFKEIIIATNATVDGQTTFFYIAQSLEKLNNNISRIAFGIPMGGELEYLDSGTLGEAMLSRKKFSNLN